MASLIYIADPMCSWCYGFGPQLSRLLEGLPETPLEIVMGGLRAYNTKPMDEALKATLLTHWRHVEERTGLPFAREALEHTGFVYDTEPACRAVVAARGLAPATQLAVFQAIQEAFYAQGRDVTRGEVLAEVAAQAMSRAGHSIDAATFQQAWAAERAVEATRADFLQVQQWGVSGFPTLVLERSGQLDLVTSGYTTVEELVAILQALVERGIESEA